MAKKDRTYLEWYKPATQVFEVGFSTEPEIVQAGTTLQAAQTPVVELHKLATEKPEAWTDVTTQVVITGESVVDDVDEVGVVLLADGAVRFRLGAETVLETPVPGDIYSLFIMANRADDPTIQVATRVWLRILP